MIEPLVALSESVLLGLHGTSQELASLSLAAVVFSFVIYTFQGLQVASLSTLSAHLKRREEDQAKQTLATIIVTAVVAGVVAAALVPSVSPFILKIVTSGSEKQGAVALALTYIHIKALALPAILTNMAGLAALVAQRRTGLVVLLALAMVSFHRLIATFFISHQGLYITGAGYSVLISQWCLCAAVLFALLLPPPHHHHHHTSSSTSPPRWMTVPLIPWLASWARLKMMAGSLGFIGLGYAFKTMSYLVCQTMSGGLPVIQLAAHQSAFALQSLALFFDAPAEKLAITFSAGISKTEARRVARSLGILGSLQSFVVGLLVWSVLTFAPRLLTSDPTTWKYLALVAPFAWVAVVLNGLELGASGVLMGRGHTKSYATLHLIVLGILLGLRTALGAFHVHTTLLSTWSMFLLFFLCRSVLANLFFRRHEGYFWMVPDRSTSIQ